MNSIRRLRHLFIHRFNNLRFESELFGIFAIPFTMLLVNQNTMAFALNQFTRNPNSRRIKLSTANFIHFLLLEKIQF